MNRYMLDTNIISYLLRSHQIVGERVRSVPMASLCMSAITGAELMYGLARRPLATRLVQAVDELMRRVEVLPWPPAAMAGYGAKRAELGLRGSRWADWIC